MHQIPDLCFCKLKIDISTFNIIKSILIIKISWYLINKNSNLFLNTISLDLSINIKEIVLAILQVIWHTTHYLPHHVMHYVIKHNKYNKIGNITATRFYSQRNYLSKLINWTRIWLICTRKSVEFKTDITWLLRLTNIQIYSVKNIKSFIIDKLFHSCMRDISLISKNVLNGTVT